MQTPSNKVVIASSNPGKLREFNHLLDSCGLQAIPQNEYNVPDIPETGLSFVENALLKARNAAEHTGLPSLADDSGIEVDALDGAPGIYSARYSGANANDDSNNQKLLAELKGIPESERTARYQCLIVYMRSATDPTPLICQGTWEGQIIDQAQGDNGFGYDPIFWLPKYQCTSAQLAVVEKNRISHRALAMQELLQRMQKITG